MEGGGSRSSWQRNEDAGFAWTTAAAAAAGGNELHGVVMT
jgi:hypothetical protein